MKKTLKLATFAMLICGVATLSACKDEDNNTPAVPSGLEVVEYTSTQATLKWTGTANATSYEVMVGTTTSSTTETTFEAKNLKANTEYKWKVRANYGNTISEWADGAAFTTDPIGGKVVPAPENLQVANITMTGAILTWSGNTPTYKLIVNGKIYNDLTETHYTLTDLEMNTTYEWSVTGINAEGKGSAVVKGEAFKTAAPAERITVKFGDLNWTPVETSLMTFKQSGMPSLLGMLYSVKNNPADDKFTVPSVYLLHATNVSTINVDTGVLIVEYYSPNYWDNPRLEEGKTDVYIGDWEPKSGYMTITAIGNGLISADYDIVLEDMLPKDYPGKTKRADTRIVVTLENARCTPEGSTASLSVGDVVPVKVMARR